MKNLIQLYPKIVLSDSVHRRSGLPQLASNGLTILFLISPKFSYQPTRAYEIRQSSQSKTGNTNQVNQINFLYSFFQEIRTYFGNKFSAETNKGKRKISKWSKQRVSKKAKQEKEKYPNNENTALPSGFDGFDYIGDNRSGSVHLHQTVVVYKIFLQINK